MAKKDNTMLLIGGAALAVYLIAQKKGMNGIAGSESGESHYYRSQLEDINPRAEYGVKVKFTDSDGNATNYLNLNKTSAAVIGSWLKRNFKK